MDVRQYCLFLMLLALTTTLRPTLGLQCFTCTSYHFDSTNPILKDVYKDINTVCTLSKDTLVTCPNPRAGTFVKCYTSTVKLQVSSQGFPVSATITSRGCTEVADDGMNGCMNGNPTGQTQELPQGMTVKSSNVTSCICSGDRCNNDDGSTSAKSSSTPSIGLSSSTAVTSTLSASPSFSTADHHPQKNTHGLECYKCTSYQSDSPNATLKDVHKATNRKCSISEENLVACAIPQAGNSAKCYTRATQVRAVDQGTKIFTTTTYMYYGCAEVTVSDGDGCMDGDPVGEAQPALPPGTDSTSITVQSVKVTNCYCSWDRCNNKDDLTTDPQSVTQSNGQSQRQLGVAISFLGLLLVLNLWYNFTS